LAYDFQVHPLYGKAQRRRCGMDLSLNRLCIQFCDGRTGITDQKHRSVPGFRVRTGGKGIQTPDAMGQSVFDQKIQCSVNDGRLAAEPIIGQAL
jgi:hypothetical protein